MNRNKKYGARKSSRAHHYMHCRCPLQAFKSLESLSSLRNEIQPKDIRGRYECDQQTRNLGWESKLGKSEHYDEQNHSEHGGDRQGATPINRKELWLTRHVLDQKISAAQGSERIDDSHQRNHADERAVVAHS